jgi:hypothetical protein
MMTWSGVLHGDTKLRCPVKHRPSQVGSARSGCALCLRFPGIRGRQAALAASLPFDALVATIAIISATAIVDAALIVMSVATTVPTLSVSVAIPAII